MQPVAAIFVDDRGIYPELLGAERCWGKRRDAFTYNGPWPVVAHPPCSRWCRLAGLVEARWGHRRGEDGGCFLRALAIVRVFGGVLEHPAHSDAWGHFRLPVPQRTGGWSEPDTFGGRAAYIEQFRYGHPAKKGTWLYAVGCWPPLRWGYRRDALGGALVSWCGNKVSPAMEGRPRLTQRAASATPEALANELISLARQSARTAT